MEWTPLPGCPDWFGAEVAADVATLLADDDGAAAAAALLDERGLLCFRDQRITPAQEVAFYKRFGLFDEAATHLVDSTASMYQIPAAPEAVVIGNAELQDHHGLSGTITQKGGNYHWHYDSDSFRTLPATASQIYCVEIPDPRRHDSESLDMSNGRQLTFAPGATGFVSTARCYELLDEPTRQYVDKCVVHYAPRYTLRTMPLNIGTGGDGVRPKVQFDPWNTATSAADGTATGGPAADGRVWVQAQGGGGGEWADSSYLGDVNKYMYSNRADEALPTSAHHPQHAVSHPLVWRHPTTGRNAVQVHAVCMHHVEHVEGDGHLSWEDSMRLIERAIVDKGAQPETVYCQAWREKDLIIWDNRQLLHRVLPAGYASAGGRRVMHRVALPGKWWPAGPLGEDGKEIASSNPFNKQQALRQQAAL